MQLISQHPVLTYQHGKKVKFSFDGKELEGFDGEPIAMALHANEVYIYRVTPEM